MLVDHYPLFGLRLGTPRLELRLAEPEELSALADLAAEGIHDPDVMPFIVEWTDQEPAVRARSVVQHYWRRLGLATPEDWGLPLAVFLGGTPVGIQQVDARRFAVLREVSTGSWLGRRYQGQGIGTEMRAAVLHLAFAGLGAREATSGAFTHNTASQNVSRKLGYRPDGIQRYVVRGQPATSQRLRLSRTDWAAHRTVPVTIEGLEPCLGQLGAAATASPTRAAQSPP
jgi:RimJ/RimL family protein N-acetyltransferase